MTDLSANQMTGEQWVFEPRTADPATTEDGERWLRADLNSGDKIATLRVDVGNSIRDVPIFATGTAVDTVSEALRIQVNGVTGYVPIAPVSDAAFPELRMQHNSEIHGFHDRVEPGPAIPDSANLQSQYKAASFDLTDGDTITTDWTDDQGSYDATPSGDPTFRENAINGQPAVELDPTDGSNDYFDTGFEQDTGVARSLYMVVKQAGGDRFYGSRGSTSDRNHMGTSGGSYYPGYGDNYTTAGTISNNYEIHAITSGSGSLEWYSNQSTDPVVSLSYNSNGLVGYTDYIGAVNDSGSVKGPLEGQIAEILRYKVNHNDTTRNDVENYLNGKYAVF